MRDNKQLCDTSADPLPPIVNPDTNKIPTHNQLWSLIPAESREKYLAKSATAPVIDLTALGYAKLLGKGRLPEAPIVVRARYVSKLAEEKILKAGGVIELTA